MEAFILLFSQLADLPNSDQYAFDIDKIFVVSKKLEDENQNNKSQWLVGVEGMVLRHKITLQLLFHLRAATVIFYCINVLVAF